MYSVRSGGVSSSGSWGAVSVGSWGRTTAGASVGSLLVPGFGSGGGGASLGGASAPPSACLAWLPVLPLGLLVPALPSSKSGQSWLSSVSSPGASANHCSVSPLVPANVAAAMPLGQCELLPPSAVCLVLIFWK